jgi:hypothetical protein
MKDNRTPEQKYADWVKAVNLCHAKGWKLESQWWIFKSPSGTSHDLSAADLEKLDEIEKNGSFLI